MYTRLNYLFISQFIYNIVMKNVLKSFFVLTNIDNVIANIHSKTHNKLFSRLIPYRYHYTEKDVKKINRYEVNFIVYPYDYSQWIIFASSDFGHISAFEHFIPKFEQEGIILDIGANMGQFSLIVAKKLINAGIKTKIIAFEANKNVYNKFCDNLNQNPNLKESVTIHNIAVGEKEGEITIQVPIRNSGAGSVVRNYEHEPHEKHHVKLNSIDNLLKDNTLPVYYIKLDVENYEYMVLQGAEKTIEKWKPTIYIEMGKGQINSAEIMKFFLDKNYKVYLENEDNTYSKIDSINQLQNVTKLYNFIMLHN